MLRALGTSLITIPLVAILESVSIAKAFSKGKIVDASQEMIALGICNILASFVSSIPITGSLTRSAVNNASGVKTQFGGLFTGALILLALGVATGTFYFIPKTVLAAVIIAAMISMFELREIVKIYQTKRIDFINFVATFVCSLWLGLEYGILVGIVINILFTLYNTSRPNVYFATQRIGSYDVLLVTPDQSLNYSSAEYFKSIVIKKSTIDFSDQKLVVIDGSFINSIDSTAAKVCLIQSFVPHILTNSLPQILSSIIIDLTINQKEVCFWNWKKDAFHVIVRHNPKYLEVFKHSNNLTDLISQMKENEALAEIT